MPRRVHVLRMGHRPQRDRRMTTHIALTARAFGAERVYIAPGKNVKAADDAVVASIHGITERFGGGFRAEVVNSWRAVVRGWPGRVVHLTMYGIPLDLCEEALRGDDDLLVVVGSEKVPSEIYELAHHNVAVGLQPHSEVAALAVLLDRLSGGKGPRDWYPGARMVILPCSRGKLVYRPGTVPTDRECEGFLALARCDPEVVAHSRAVVRVAEAMARRLPVDRALVRAGAYLHDVGRAVSHGIDHGLAGARLVREWGMGEALARIVEVHVGAGIAREECGRLGLPPGEYIPRTLEEVVVCHADNMLKDGQRIGHVPAVERLLAKGEVAAADRVRAMHRDLAERLGRDPDELALEADPFAPWGAEGQGGAVIAEERGAETKADEGRGGDGVDL